ncbi:MAG: type II toxin-antitoxin system VapC family toxin [Phycisphaerales bacterium]|nr:type II toxin-antitoxin system VapC family toxin [Phycisphaerales bacterium]
MYAVDTNILVRLLTQDDPAQAALAKQVFAKTVTIHIPVTVFLETEWVLRYSYGFGATEIAEALRKVLALSNVQTAVPEVLQTALEHLAQGLDFADALHLALSPAKSTMLTFDRSFARKAAKMGYTRIKNL